MPKKYAVRNIRLCTKDCLCLYVCPTGATDTENSIIDITKCIGCGDCAEACPSGAISMVPFDYPDQQEKTEAVISVLRNLVQSKSKQESISSGLQGKLFKAFQMSNHIQAEDIIREAGYMLPQSDNALAFLKSQIKENQSKDFPKEKVEKLIELLSKNKEKQNMKDKTYENLMAAFTGESEANRKYTAYAKKAEKEGKLNAAKLFRAAADAETIHALKHFEIAGKIGSTADNLKDGVAGETYEYKDMYPDFVKEAKESGNKAAEMTFTFAMKAEEVHARLYQEALENIDENEEVFYFLCPVCGNIEKSVPERCSICGVPGSKFIKY